MIIEALALNVLFLDQVAESNIKGLTVEQTLSLTDSLDANLLPQVLSSFLDLSHLALVEVDYDLSISQTLTFAQETQPRAIVLEVSQMLFLVSEAIREDMFPLVVSTLSLDHEAVGIASKHTATALALSHTVTVAITYGRTIEHSLTPSSEAAGYLPSKYWHSYEIEVIAP